jgi:uncharacterized oxidoreductase
MPKIRSQSLRDLVRDIFVAAGCSETEGTQLGKSLVSANLAGHDSHGVVRVPRYVQWKDEGAFIPGVTVKVVSETPVLAVLDACYGFGQTTAPQAVAIGIKKCKEMGLSCVSMRNSGHVGRVGEWAEMAAEEGLVSMHFVNAVNSLLVAPYGGVDRRLSTAPYAIGIPRPGDDPLILDFATSVVAEGKVLVASQGGKKLPDNALIAPDGAINGDPHTLYGDYTEGGPRNYKTGPGAIRAFGEHKGSGLAFMVEVLGGSLTGTGAADPDQPKWANGMLSIYIDPKRIDPVGFFPADVQRYVAFFKSSRPTAGTSEVLVPGEPEIRNRKTREAEGVPLPEETWEAICTTARQVGLGDNRLKAALQ